MRRDISPVGSVNTLIMVLIGMALSGVICVGWVCIAAGRVAMRIGVRMIRILRSAGRTRDEV